MSSDQASTGDQASVFTGACLCGQVRYSARTRQASAMVCHCRACQRQSGSAFSVNLAVPRSDLSWQGELRTHAHQADSGHTVHRRFCPDCGSPVLTESPQRPALVFIKAGTLDEPERIQPTVHLWCEQKQPWVTLPEGMPCLATQPALT